MPPDLEAGLITFLFDNHGVIRNKIPTMSIGKPKIAQSINQPDSIFVIDLMCNPDKPEIR
jgi:hypothetical protein